MRVPQTAQYSIDAKSRIGDVTSDLPGSESRKHFGHVFVRNATEPHALYLRTGFGDIMILRIHRPAGL